VPFGIHSYPGRFSEQRLAEGVTAVWIDAPSRYYRDCCDCDQNGD